MVSQVNPPATGGPQDDRPPDAAVIAANYRDEISVLCGNPLIDRTVRAAQVSEILGKLLALPAEAREPVMAHVEATCRDARHAKLYQRVTQHANGEARKIAAAQKAAEKASNPRVKKLGERNTAPGMGSHPGILWDDGKYYVPFNLGYPFRNADSGDFASRPADWKGNVWDGIWFRFDPASYVKPDSRKGLYFAWNLVKVRLREGKFTEEKTANGSIMRYMAAVQNRFYSLKTFNRNPDTENPGEYRTEICPVPVEMIISEQSVSPALTYTLYEVTPDGRLDENHPRRLAIFTDPGGHKRQIAATQTYLPQRMGEVFGTLGLVSVESPGEMVKLLRYMMLDLHNRDQPIHAIQAAGPVYDLEGHLILVTNSGCYDEKGGYYLDYQAETSDMPDHRDRELHDLMPPDEITPELLAEGLSLIGDVLQICPHHPEVPAAFLGQKMVSVLSALSIAYWNHLYLWGEPSSGKTYFNRLMSAMESKTMREYGDTLPDMNLGDPSTAVGSKGPATRLRFGTFAIEDVTKKGAANQAQSKINTAIIDRLNRSRLDRAGTQGTIDRVNDRQTYKSRGQLFVSARSTAETLPVIDGSNEMLDGVSNRMLTLGGFSSNVWSDWFEPKLADVNQGKLWEPAAITALYAAYSYVSHWVWVHYRKPELDDVRMEAVNICQQWPESLGRIRDHYKVSVCGLLVIQKLAREAGHPLGTSDTIPDAIEALRLSALARLSRASRKNLADEFLDEMQLAFRSGAFYARGRRATETDGATPEFTPYIETQNKDGNPGPVLWPAGSNNDPETVGLTVNRERKRTDGIPVIIRPPTSKGSPWVFLIQISTDLPIILRRLNKDRGKDAREFTAEDITVALVARYPKDKVKTRDRVYAEGDTGTPGTAVGNPVSVLAIRTEYVLERPED